MIFIIKKINLNNVQYSYKNIIILLEIVKNVFYIRIHTTLSDIWYMLAHTNVVSGTGKLRNTQGPYQSLYVY